VKPVVQEEKTGCGIASVAAVAGVTYKEAKRAANSLGIYAEDKKLWSETVHVRALLKRFRIRASRKQQPFRSWPSLPNLALIAIKWHQENHLPFWHWAVFVRTGDRGYVLDSKKVLRHHVRTDFWRMKPKWFISLRQ
jgi:ABC-type bacteriocin/lantibiotic exporter with double-glycine peptidase domain